jgi:hypothetical protein
VKKSLDVFERVSYCSRPSKTGEKMESEKSSITDLNLIYEVLLAVYNRNVVDLQFGCKPSQQQVWQLALSSEQTPILEYDADSTECAIVYMLRSEEFGCVTFGDGPNSWRQPTLTAKGMKYLVELAYQREEVKMTRERHEWDKRNARRGETQLICTIISVFLSGFVVCLSIATTFILPAVRQSQTPPQQIIIQLPSDFLQKATIAPAPNAVDTPATPLPKQCPASK